MAVRRRGHGPPPPMPVSAAPPAAQEPRAVVPKPSKPRATCCRHNPTDLLWLEKLLIMLDFVQDHAVLWGLAHTWGWPSAWQNATLFTLLFNLDLPSASLVSTSASAGQWGHINGLYALFAGGLLMLAVLTMLIGSGYALFKRARGHARRTAIERLLHPEGSALFAARLFVGSFALALLRLCVCDGDTLAADNTMLCGGGVHIALLVGALPLGVVLISGALVAVQRVTYNNSPHRQAVAHEQWLLTSELAHALRWNASWRTAQVWVVSSFRRPASYRHLMVMVRKLALALLFVALRSYPEAQASLVLVLFLVDAALITVVPPYRSIESNLFCFTSRWTLVVTSILGVVSAFKTTSPLLADGTLTTILVAVHLLALVLLVLATLLALARCARWPASFPRGGSAEAAAIARWTVLVEEAKECMRLAQLTPASVLQVEAIVPVERKLRAAADEARARASPLHAALRRIIEDLESLRLEAQRHGLTLRHEVNDQLLNGDLRRRLQTRAHDLALVPPNRRRVLLKLLALRTVRFVLLHLSVCHPLCTPFPSSPLIPAIRVRVTPRHVSRQSQSFQVMLFTKLQKYDRTHTTHAPTLPQHAPSRVCMLSLPRHHYHH